MISNGVKISTEDGLARCPACDRPGKYEAGGQTCTESAWVWEEQRLIAVPNRPKSPITEIFQHPSDGYSMANVMYRLCPGDTWYNDSSLASSAYAEAGKAGWSFYGYNDYGQETWAPPNWKESRK